MATLARGGRITTEIVDEEIARLRAQWSTGEAPSSLADLLDEEQLAELDPFDRVQLEHVVNVARRARSLSDAGRLLFAQSRQKRTSVNDADRLRKYFARFGLEWSGGVVRRAT
jgi:transcriptional regulatory protein RtcR